LLSVADTIQRECTSLGHYLALSSEPLLQLISNQSWFSREDPKKCKSLIEDKHMAAWMGKALHGHFCKDVLPLVDLKWQWYWIEYAKYTKETEGFIFAAQEQALTTNVMKRQIFHLDTSSLCRLCRSAYETINHLISSCFFIAQSAYKVRHDRLAKFIHWKLACCYGFEVV